MAWRRYGWDELSINHKGSEQAGGLVPDLRSVVAELRQAREAWRASQAWHVEHGGASFPARTAIASIVEDISAALYPLRLGPDHVGPHNEDDYVAVSLESALSRLAEQVDLELAYAWRAGREGAEALSALDIVRQFALGLPRIRTLIDTDVEAAYLGDPAASSVDEVLICYPGIFAVTHHRIAHALYLLGAKLVARMISEVANSKTGIDIHPGAQLGEGFFIDHGTGVVIGETAIIGRRVRLYQAVTLGARSFPTDPSGALRKGDARHPIVEDDVVIYAGATLLGRITIGRGSTIGGNVWLTDSVPPHSRVHQAQNETIVRRSASNSEELTGVEA